MSFEKRESRDSFPSWHRVRQCIKKYPDWNELKNIAGHLFAILSRGKQKPQTSAALVSYLHIFKNIH